MNNTQESPKAWQPPLLVWFPMGFLLLLGAHSLIETVSAMFLGADSLIDLGGSMRNRLLAATMFGLWSVWFVRRRRRRLQKSE